MVRTQNDQNYGSEELDKCLGIWIEEAPCRSAATFDETLEIQHGNQTYHFHYCTLMEMYTLGNQFIYKFDSYRI